MPSDANDRGFYLLRLQVLPYLLSGFYAIHDWHAEVSKYDTVAHSILVGPLDLAKSLLAMDAVVYLVVGVYPQAVEHSSHGRDAELLVIHHKDSVAAKLGVFVIAIKHLV